MIISRATTTSSSLFILFFCALGFVLSSPDWTIYEVSHLTDRTVYDKPRTPTDNTPAALISLIDVPALVQLYGNSEVREPFEILLIKGISSSSSSSGSSKKKSKSKSVSSSSSDSGLLTNTIQGCLNELYEDYTAAFFVTNLSSFVDNYCKRLYGTPPKINSEIEDSLIFDQVKAIKFSFIGKNKFIIYSYVEGYKNPLRDQDLKLFLNFSSKLSSFSVSAVPDLIIKSNDGFQILVDSILQKQAKAPASAAPAELPKASRKKKSSSKSGSSSSQPKLSAAEAEANLKKLVADEERERKLKAEKKDLEKIKANQHKAYQKAQKEESAKDRLAKKLEAEKEKLAVRQEQSKRDIEKKEQERLAKEQKQEALIAAENAKKLKIQEADMLRVKEEEKAAALKLANEKAKERDAKAAEETNNAKLSGSSSSNSSVSSLGASPISSPAILDESGSPLNPNISEFRPSSVNFNPAGGLNEIKYNNNYIADRHRLPSSMEIKTNFDGHQGQFHFNPQSRSQHLSQSSSTSFSPFSGPDLFDQSLLSPPNTFEQNNSFGSLRSQSGSSIYGPNSIASSFSPAAADTNQEIYQSEFIGEILRSLKLDDDDNDN